MHPGLASSLRHHNLRAFKMAVIAVGLAMSVSLSTLLAGTPWGMALALGVVSAAATFICGAWSARPPAAYFFILAAAIGTALPVHPSAFALRGGFVLVGGAAAWFINMAAWPWHTYGPETRAAAAAYRTLANFAASCGTHQQNTMLVQSQLALNDAEDAVSMAGSRRRRGNRAQRLLRLTNAAQSIFLHLIERAAEGGSVSPNVDVFLRSLADAVTDPGSARDIYPRRRTIH